MDNPFKRVNHRQFKSSVVTAAAMAKMSEFAYLDKDPLTTACYELGFNLLAFADVHDSQAFLAGNNRIVVVSFRGTEPDVIADWLTDLNAFRIKPEGFVGQVHAGFFNATSRVWLRNSKKQAGLFEVMEMYRETCFKKNGFKPVIYLTGHSMGGAMATIAAAFMLKAGKPIYGLYTFGSPRVGDESFSQWLSNGLKDRFMRVVNNNDAVTRVPLRSMGYSHCGELGYIYETGKFSRDPSSWWMFLDRALGMLYDIGEVGIDAIKDHAIADYVKFLSQFVESNNLKE